jgi:catechol 2,3-dioxygenase
MTTTTSMSSASSGGVAVRPRLGHVAIGVADLERAGAFYRDLIGLDVTAWGPDDGVPLVVLGQADHPLGVVLMAFDSAGGSPPPPGHTGLSHLALVFDGPEPLATAARRLIDAEHPIDHATDHEATVSVYLEDTEGNGLELYYERPRERWSRPDGRPQMRNDPVDLELVLTAALG